MERADQRVLSALAALQQNDDWPVVMDWLKESYLADANALLLTKDEVQTRWLQGSLQTLGNIIDLGERARKILHDKRS